MERAVGVLAEARVFEGVGVGEVVLSQEEGLLDSEGGGLRGLVADFLAEWVVAGELAKGSGTLDVLARASLTGSGIAFVVQGMASQVGGGKSVKGLLTSIVVGVEVVWALGKRRLRL